LTTFEILPLRKDNNRVWSENNCKYNQGSVFHTTEWQELIEKTTSWKSEYFIVYRDGEPCALCPFFYNRHKKIKYYYCLAQADYNNIIFIQNNYGDDSETILKHIVAHLWRNKGWGAILSKEGYRDVKISNKIDLTKTGLMHLDLRGRDVGYFWEEYFSKKDNQRKYISRFEKDGYYITENSLNDLEIFYKYYLENMNFIGAKPYSYMHFELLRKMFNENSSFVYILRNEQTVAGGLVGLVSKNHKEMYLRYLALNRRLPNTYHPPYALYWHAIKNAIKNDLQSICFGHTPNDSSDENFRLKRKFGCDFIEDYNVIIFRNWLLSASYRLFKKS
jgi:hypothetical protein